MNPGRQAMLIFLGVIVASLFVEDAQSQGNAQRGAEAFGACAACHSIKPGEHMTGPSLARLWGHKAGTAEGFMRYSDALLNSGVAWNEQTLDQWLANPARFIPNNAMNFPGIKEARTRQDVIAYLEAVSEGKAPAATRQRRGMMGGGMMGGGMMGGGMMGGGMMGGGRTNLKQTPADTHVATLAHCRDNYTVSTASGKTYKIWEFNLRLKTDSSEYGPSPGKPVMTGSGMMGDRYSIVFASPADISVFIKESCQ